MFHLAKKQWGYFVLGSFIGLLPLLTLIFFANNKSPVIWGQPDNLKDWWWLVSGRLYLPNTFDFSQIDWANRFPSWLSYMLVPMALLALSMSFLITSKYWSSFRRTITIMLLTALIFVGYALGYSTDDALVLLLPGLLLVCIVVGLGIAWSGRYAILLALIMLIYGGIIITSETGPSLRPRFEQALSLVPAKSIIITPGDPTVAATWYFAYAEGQRTDVIVVDDNMFQFSWYRAHLAERYPGLVQLSEDNLPAFIQANIRRYAICRISMYSEIHLSCEEPKI